MSSGLESILVLEDDENLRETIVDVLEGSDLSAIGVADAASAVVMAEKYPVDLVISDIRMAGAMDGLGALELLKARRKDLLCIVMTGYTDESSPHRALSIQVEDYLYKPFEVTTLLQAILRVRQSKSRRDLLQKEQSRQELTDLYVARSDTFKFFWVAVRSRVLTPDAIEPVLSCWDVLEEYEEVYIKLRDSLAQVGPAELRELTERYRAYLKFVQLRLKAKNLPAPRARQEGDVTREQMKLLLQRIEKDELSLEDLHWAAIARKKDIRGEMSQRIWGFNFQD